ncbi:hypothetical protein F2Q68_00033532 [Brassica cretica]|uniref:Uncharacterized protein n=1 Tax=Brassica cretica TaxID=69181 RepID=A0A8S9H4I1_BRACR|nr:hypothetical protein F2Q68_00033532 [Brassica cretica]
MSLNPPEIELSRRISPVTEHKIELDGVDGRVSSVAVVSREEALHALTADYTSPSPSPVWFCHEFTILNTSGYRRDLTFVCTSVAFLSH